MKTFAEQTFYELLEVPVEASAEAIERAFERAMACYGPDSLATYSLVEPGQAAELIKLIEEAYLTLSDPQLRKAYDRDHAAALAQLRAAEEKPQPPQEPAPAQVAEPPPAQVAPSEGPGAPAVPDGADSAERSLEDLAPTPDGTAAAAAIPASALLAPLAPAREPEPPPAPPEPVKVPVPSRPPLPGVSRTPTPFARPRYEPSKPTPAKPAAAKPEPAPKVPAESAANAAPPPPAAITAPRPAPKPFELPADVNGEVLRRAREARGLTVKELSERTKIGQPHLENIEADRYAALPPPVYLRGFLMSVSRELKLDPLKVSKCYLDLVARAKAGPP